MSTKVHIFHVKFSHSPFSIMLSVASLPSPMFIPCYLLGRSTRSEACSHLLISSATTLMSASSSWTLSYHLVLFSQSQHFTITTISMLSVVRRAHLYVTTTQPVEMTHSNRALVAHIARSSRTMGARVGYAIFPLRAHQYSTGSDEMISCGR